MKTLIFALLFCINAEGKSQYNDQQQKTFDFEPTLDTAKFHINYLPIISKDIYESFHYAAFLPLVLYTDSTVDYINAIDTSNIKGVCMYSTDAITTLQTLFNSFNYCCYKMSSKPMNNGNDLIYIRVFVFPDREKYGMDVFFEIKDKSKIVTIAVQ